MEPFKTHFESLPFCPRVEMLLGMETEVHKFDFFAFPVGCRTLKLVGDLEAHALKFRPPKSAPSA